MSLQDYFISKPTITASRLMLRPMVPDDANALSEWLPDKELYDYWGKGPSKAELNPALLFEKAQKPTKSFHLGIALMECGKVIGDIYVYLIENDRMASVSIRIGRRYQGNGYGSEALQAMTKFCFTNTELKRLHAEIDVRNVASQKIFEHCGYTREGLVRQGKLVNTWCDYYIYGILNTDV